MRAPDLAVILAYLLFITWFGARFKEKQATVKDYFLGGRTAPWSHVSPVYSGTPEIAAPIMTT